MANDEPVDLIASRLMLIGADGRRAEFTPDGMKIEGPNGTIDASFDSSGSPMLTLYTKDAQSSASIVLSEDSAGLLLQTGTKSSHLLSSGLSVVDDHRMTLVDSALAVQSLDGRLLFYVPFLSLNRAKQFCRGLGGRLKAALSALTAPAE